MGWKEPGEENFISEVRSIFGDFKTFLAMRQLLVTTLKHISDRK
jgi:hypothetical protein